MASVGFGIVSTDAVAAHLARQLPTATELILALSAEGGVSRGTATTVLAGLAAGGVTRQGGQAVPVRPASSSAQIDFGAGPVRTPVNPWRGDLSTAPRTTGIDTVRTYSTAPRTSSR